MKRSMLTLTLLLLSLPALSQEDSPSESEGTRDLLEIIEDVADEIGKEIVVDPRARGIRVISTRDEIDFESLLGILRLHQFFAIETDDRVFIQPEQNARASATRVLQEDDSRVSDHEIVTRVLVLPDLPESPRPAARDETESNPFFAAERAAQLVPVLRPMMAQTGQLGAVPNSNILVMVDRYDNIRRMTAVIEEIIEGLED